MATITLNPRKTTLPIYRELTDFLTSSPTPAQIAAFKISSRNQRRLENLLDKNREEGLTLTERAEIETYLELSQAVARLKARVDSLQLVGH